MTIEYEATFPNIDKSEFRDRLIKVEAKLLRPEFLQKRKVFHLPSGHEIPGGWIRLRDEVDKITMGLKVIDGTNITNQKEIFFNVNDFEKAAEFLISIGCVEKGFQESKRELWALRGAEITIDEWPFLEPFCEIEGSSEKTVKETASILGFDYSRAKFCSIDVLYSEKYGFSTDVINSHTPRLLFDMENPFIK